MKSRKMKGELVFSSNTLMKLNELRSYFKKVCLVAILGFTSLAYADDYQNENNQPPSRKQGIARIKLKSVIRPFSFDSKADSYLHEQKTYPVCVDFLNHLNHPRNNELFKYDGSLVNESEKIRSVRWETLDKEKYRSGFMSFVDGERLNLQELYLKHYADPQRSLQRIMAFPKDLRQEVNRTPLWLYRIVPQINIGDSHNQLTSMVWFPEESIEWLGDENGKFKLRGKKELGLGGQMFLHNGMTYGTKFLEVKNKSKVFLHLAIYQFYVDLRRNSFITITCEFRSDSN